MAYKSTLLNFLCMSISICYKGLQKYNKLDDVKDRQINGLVRALTKTHNTTFLVSSYAPNNAPKHKLLSSFCYHMCLPTVLMTIKIHLIVYTHVSGWEISSSRRVCLLLLYSHVTTVLFFSNSHCTKCPKGVIDFLCFLA